MELVASVIIVCAFYVILFLKINSLRKKIIFSADRYEKLITSLKNELEKYKAVDVGKEDVIDAKDKLIVELSNKTNEAERKASILEYNYKELDDKFRTTLNQKVSSEVKMGRIGEQFVCFLDQWPYNPNDFRFIGSPIDGLSFNFDKDEIVFVEIKTGNSRLSDKQKKCREIIKNGNVKFMEFRVGVDGVNIKENGVDVTDDLVQGIKNEPVPNVCLCEKSSGIN